MDITILFKKNLWTPGWGEISLSAFIIALISGVFLIPFFESSPDPFKSISIFINYSTLNHLLHSLHSYSGDLFLIAGFMHTFEYIYKKSYTNYSFKPWFFMVLLSVFSLLAVFSGFLSIGSKGSFSAISIVSGILSRLSVVGTFISEFLFPNEQLSVIYMHHIATFTILSVILIYVHIKKLKPESYALYYTLTILIIFSIAFPEGIGFSPETPLEVIKGPWYFIGFQEMLGWLPVWIAGLLFPIIILIFFSIFPYIKERKNEILYGFMLITFFYFAESIIGYFFRGDEWQFLFR